MSVQLNSLDNLLQLIYNSLVALLIRKSALSLPITFPKCFYSKVIGITLLFIIRGSKSSLPLNTIILLLDGLKSMS